MSHVLGVSIARFHRLFDTQIEASWQQQRSSAAAPGASAATVRTWFLAAPGNDCFNVQGRAKIACGLWWVSGSRSHVSPCFTTKDTEGSLGCERWCGCQVRQKDVVTHLHSPLNWVGVMSAHRFTVMKNLRTLLLHASFLTDWQLYQIKPPVNCKRCENDVRCWKLTWRVTILFLSPICLSVRLNSAADLQFGSQLWHVDGNQGKTKETYWTNLSSQQLKINSAKKGFIYRCNRLYRLYRFFFHRNGGPPSGEKIGEEND